MGPPACHSEEPGLGDAGRCGTPPASHAHVLQPAGGAELRALGLRDYGVITTQP